jgi:hypothetical protein
MEQPFDFSSAVTKAMIDSQNVTYTNAAGEEKKCFDSKILAMNFLGYSCRQSGALLNGSTVNGWLVSF